MQHKRGGENMRCAIVIVRKCIRPTPFISVRVAAKTEGSHSCCCSFSRRPSKSPCPTLGCMRGDHGSQHKPACPRLIWRGAQAKPFSNVFDDPWKAFPGTTDGQLHPEVGEAFAGTRFSDTSDTTNTHDCDSATDTC
ncbi:hypothetical protein SCLCIDRAFT_549623 [Scleroderma citrinum Foug A]|uniref:Uncharacterized protein n=1 Tax=Scleroderma citrinum Foug A TaxID=1036808 RepID=A0A0C2YS85_9AGAM|nr:hypothetical protein SCLCIDRAFT_549623 [Scleroderma citrinum Foug A]